ncbi:MAG: hypothetical protein NTV07_05305 [Candidatus Omnitrophica bacterium]|nr:hypothetical protein [Candidatus Omnitrophota bacterium]
MKKRIFVATLAVTLGFVLHCWIAAASVSPESIEGKAGDHATICVTENYPIGNGLITVNTSKGPVPILKPITMELGGMIILGPDDPEYRQGTIIETGTAPDITYFLKEDYDKEGKYLLQLNLAQYGSNAIPAELIGPQVIVYARMKSSFWGDVFNVYEIFPLTGVETKVVSGTLKTEQVNDPVNGTGTLILLETLTSDGTLALGILENLGTEFQRRIRSYIDDNLHVEAMILRNRTNSEEEIYLLQVYDTTYTSTILVGLSEDTDVLNVSVPLSKKGNPPPTIYQIPVTINHFDQVKSLESRLASLEKSFNNFKAQVTRDQAAQDKKINTLTTKTATLERGLLDLKNAITSLNRWAQNEITRIWNYIRNRK